MKKTFAGILLVSSSLVLAEDTFTLGEISITDKQDTVLDVKKVSNEELLGNPEKNIAKVLDTQAGITIEHKGGREESSLMIRGLEASRTGIYIDGIPVYNPYDGNYDYSRILSTDLASVDIAKGFSSALFGPNTMSGVVNFVTKKPTKEFEGSFSSQLNTDNDFTKSQTINTLSLGSKQEKYYFQFSGTLKDRDHWNLSEDFEATSLQPDENERMHSDSNSKSFNLKAGYTPNDTLEYVLGFNYLDSAKSQPTIVDQNDGNRKFIDWPTWDSNSVYFITNKKFDTSALKFKLYRTSYKNTYEEYTNATFSAFKSIEYTDAHSIGSGLEYSEYGWSDEHIVKFALNFKKDTHEIERDVKNPDENDKFAEKVYSLAVEDIYQPNDKLKVIASLSYDYANPIEAITYNDDISDEIKSNDAINAQLGFFYDFLPNQTTRFTVARKTHLPTLKERFSDKRGKALINPDLDPEKATHYELGHNIKSGNFVADAAVFYIDVKDPIRIVPKAVSGLSADQEQNTGTEEYKGFETTLKYEKDTFATGFNYTYTKIEKDDGSVVVTDVPKHQAYFYASYSPVKSLTLSGNIAYKKDLTVTDASDNYVELASITVAGINVDYQYSKALSFSAGVENLTDELYELDLGYPEPGREYYAKFTYNF